MAEIKHIFFMTVWYFYIIIKFYTLIIHNQFDKNKPIQNYFRKKNENFLFFSPRLYKIRKIDKILIKENRPTKLFTDDTVRIHGDYIKLSDKPVNESKIVLFFLGQSENISKWQSVYYFLKELGISCFYLSYRGHYRSAGRPSEEGIYKDAEAAINFLKKEGYKEENIILWGRSLGTAVATKTALKYNVNSVILESGIYNIHEAVISVFNNYVRIFKFPLIKQYIYELIKNADFSQKFANNERIQLINAPILLIHSKNDKKIDYKNSERLHELNPKAKLVLVEDGSHDKNEWTFEYIKEFFRENNIIN